MKVFLDDERATPEGWVRVHWPDEAIALLKTGAVQQISLDHDLGDDQRGTGYDVVLWIEQAVATEGFRPPPMAVHSANASARLKMLAGIRAIEQLAARQSNMDAHADAHDSLGLTGQVGLALPGDGQEAMQRSSLVRPELEGQRSDPDVKFARPAKACAELASIGTTAALDAPRVVYELNDLAGGFLELKAWQGLEAAGWQMQWPVPVQTTRVDISTRPQLPRMAVRLGLRLDDAKAEWERVTGQRADEFRESDCRCCGGYMHTFDEY